MSAVMTREKGSSLVDFVSDYTVIDIETTGFDPRYDEIIEISAIRYRDDAEVDSFQALVRPYKIISEFITEKTGITNDMVRSASEISSVLPGFLDFIQDDILIGHNVHFDINFLYDVSLRCLSHKLQNDFIDTLRISRRLLRDLPNHQLDTLMKHFCIDARQFHRSMGDCGAAAGCYQGMKAYISDNAIDTKVLFSANTKKKRGVRASDIQTQVDEFDIDHPIYGRVCVFTGALEKMIRKEAMQLVIDLGGVNGDNVTSKTNYLILGNNDYCSSIKDGKSRKQKKAEQLILEGQDLRIISENVFYDLVEME